MQPVKKWAICYGEYNDTQKHAIDFLQSELSKRVGYPVNIYANKNLTVKHMEEFRIIYVGTAENNPHVARFLKEKPLNLPTHEEGYAFCVTPTSNNEQEIFIIGNRPVGVLYAVMHFVNEYLSHRLYYTKNYRITDKRFFNAPANEPFPAYEAISAPSVRERGLWTWGHVIYDYKSYLFNMAKLRFNIIIIWILVNRISTNTKRCTIRNTRYNNFCYIITSFYSIRNSETVRVNPTII